jgi:hypothetical protein
MRQINNFEKEILIKIIHYYNNGIISNLASVIDHKLNNKDIYLDFIACTAEIRADVQFYNAGTLIDEVRRLTLEIVTTVNLLQDLQNNRYVTLFLETPLPNNYRYGQLVNGNTFIPATINDPAVRNLLLDFSLKSILVGQPLIDFVNNGFRTDEKVQADQEKVRAEHESSINRRNLNIAVIALVLSTLLTFWEIYNGTQEVKYGKMQLEQEQNVKLNETQQQAIENKLADNKKLLEQTKEVLQEIKKIEVEKTHTPKTTVTEKKK